MKKLKELINSIKRFGNLRKPFSRKTSLIRTGFDLDFYLSSYPDIADAEGVDPVEHYCLYGWKEGRDPTPNFSTDGYLEVNQDVRDAGINPFFHYLATGKNEGREAVAPARHEAGDTASADEISLIRTGFDLDFYLSSYPDIADAEGFNAVEHYCLYGWKEGRDPTPKFSTSYYLEANKDVHDAGINPFFHYLIGGKDEGRQAVHPGGHVAAILANMASLEDTIATPSPKEIPKNPLSESRLFSELSETFEHGAEGLMLSISHDNYRKNSGGVQYGIQREEATAKKRRFAYLHLSPYEHLPCLAPADKNADALVTIVLDSQEIGVAKMSSLTKAVQRVSSVTTAIEVVIHHLMGHRLEQIAELVRVTGNDQCWIWLHDYFTLCPSFALQRNNVAFCSAPVQTSNACFLCNYGKERLQHHQRMLAFFQEFAVHAIAPSKFTADFWSAKTDLPYASLNICNHMKIESRETRVKQSVSDGPITVAFVGFPGVHKGWPMFENILREIPERKSNIRFLYFGTSNVHRQGLETVPVEVTAEDPGAMIDALAKEEVDFVLHWATCAETFSFSTHEAIAAGAYVLTNPGSGNVAKVVKCRGDGLVLTDEVDLLAFFEDGRMERLAEAVRLKRSSTKVNLTYSNLTFDVINRER